MKNGNLAGTVLIETLWNVNINDALKKEFGKH